MPESTPVQPAESGLSDNTAGWLAYLTFIPAIIFLVAEPYNKNSFIRFHSWQCIFLSIACFAINMVLGMTIILLILTPIVSCGFLVVVIICMIKANKGERYKLPLIGNLAEKQAGA
jgi:uncharacterized membrane protein